VDANAGTRESAFDHEKLAATLSKVTGTNYSTEKLPFDSIEFADDAKGIRFKLGDTEWSCNLNSYECIQIAASDPAKKE